MYRSCLSRWLAARPVRVGYWGGEFLCVLISFALTYHGIHVLLIIVVSPSSRRFILCSLVPAPRCFLVPLCASFCACTLPTWRYRRLSGIPQQAPCYVAACTAWFRPHQLLISFNACHCCQCSKCVVNAYLGAIL